MTKKKIQALTFDLWETLIADSPSLDEKRTRRRVAETGRVLARHGIVVKNEDLSRAHRQVWEQCLKEWKRATDLPFEKQVDLFLELTQKGLSKRLTPQGRTSIARIYAEAGLKFPPRPIQGGRETLSALKKEGHRLGLICNTGRTPGYILRKLLRKYRLLRYFDVALFSDEILVRKPDPEIFRLALKALGCRPESALHVGDDLKNDVQGALKAGMRAVWIEQPAQKAPAVIKRIKSVAAIKESLTE